MKKIILTTLLISVFTLNIFAAIEGIQEYYESSSIVTAKYLDIGAGAAASGMGNAYIGLAKDAVSMFWNPAGLANMSKEEKNWTMFFSHNVWVMESSIDHLSVAKNFPKVGVFAVGIEYFNAGAMDKYTIDANNNYVADGTFTPYALVGNIAYSNTMEDGIDFGINGKYVMDNIDDSIASTFAFDIGLRYHAPLKGLDFSILAKNFAGALNGYILPKEISFSGAYTHDFENFSLMGDIDVCGKVASSPVYRYGLEVFVLNLVSIRAGYQYDDSYSNDGLTDFTLGAGININDKYVDFSYEPYGDFGTSFKFSIGGDF